MKISDDDLVKISFPIAQDEDGYPGVAVEHIWAIKHGEHSYIIDNIPFYTNGISAGDVVKAQYDEEGRLCFSQLIKPSGNTTVRIVFLESLAKSEIRGIMKHLVKLGAEFEGAEGMPHYALNVPAKVDYAPIKRLLSQCFELGKLDYEESVLAHSPFEDDKKHADPSKPISWLRKIKNLLNKYI